MTTAIRKSERQGAILEIVRRQPVATQSELRDALAARGLECDQATVSRDIRELGLVKAAGEDGGYYYASIEDVSPAVRVSRVSVLRQMVKAVIPSGNLLVLKCGPGNGPSVGEALDHLGLAEIVGSVAGDDTLLAVVREGASAKRVAEKLLKEIGQK
jgi:transcriptional regulator of arginine metabolism